MTGGRSKPFDGEETQGYTFDAADIYVGRSSGCIRGL